MRCADWQVKSLADIGNIVVADDNGIPVYVKDVATSARRHRVLVSSATCGSRMRSKESS